MNKNKRSGGVGKWRGNFRKTFAAVFLLDKTRVRKIVEIRLKGGWEREWKARRDGRNPTMCRKCVHDNLADSGRSVFVF